MYRLLTKFLISLYRLVAPSPCELCGERSVGFGCIVLKRRGEEGTTAFTVGPPRRMCGLCMKGFYSDPEHYR